jgi:hypothetical protein
MKKLCTREGGYDLQDIEVGFNAIAVACCPVGASTVTAEQCHLYELASQLYHVVWTCKTAAVDATM